MSLVSRSARLPIKWRTNERDNPDLSAMFISVVLSRPFSMTQDSNASRISSDRCLAILGLLMMGVLFVVINDNKQ